MKNEKDRDSPTIRGHWGNRSPECRRFQVAFDFIAQLEVFMGRRGVTATILARRLKVTKGRVSQVLNHPGNLTLGSAIEWARGVKVKVALVAYDDDDPMNLRGPINSQVFAECWRRCGCPRDFFDLGLAESSPAVDAVAKGRDVL
jgi:hypothetical protein